MQNWKSCFEAAAKILWPCKIIFVDLKLVQIVFEKRELLSGKSVDLQREVVSLNPGRLVTLQILIAEL